MSRKKRKTYNVLPMPKLGWKDRLFYIVIMGLLIGLALSNLFVVDEISRWIAFMDGTAVAYSGGKGSLNCIWLSLWWVVMALLVLVPFLYRYPICGRKDVEYGPPKYPFVYPLLMQNKPVKRYSKKEGVYRKKRNRLIVALLVGSFVICVLLVPLSVCGRTVICEDGSLEEYDMFNRFSRRYAVDEIETVSIELHQSSRSLKYHVTMDVETSDGKQVPFASSGFEGDQYTELCRMIEMKELYGELCVIGDTYDLSVVASRLQMTEREEEKLHELFGVPVP